MAGSPASTHRLPGRSRARAAARWRMSAPANAATRSYAEPAGPAGAEDRRRKRFANAFLAACALALLGTITWQAGSERRAIARLPDEVRRGVFSQTLEAFSELCRGPERDDLRSHCREQARFLALFPECGARCGDLAAPYLHRATR